MVPNTQDLEREPGPAGSLVGFLFSFYLLASTHAHDFTFTQSRSEKGESSYFPPLLVDPVPLVVVLEGELGDGRPVGVRVRQGATRRLVGHPEGGGRGGGQEEARTKIENFAQMKKNC